MSTNLKNFLAVLFFLTEVRASTSVSTLNRKANEDLKGTESNHGTANKNTKIQPRSRKGVSLLNLHHRSSSRSSSSKSKSKSQGRPFFDPIAPPNFRLLDDLNPVSPHELIGDPQEPSSVSGYWDYAQVFPAYLKPEVFPQDENVQSNQQWNHREPDTMRLDKGSHTIIKYRNRPADATWPNGELHFPRVEKDGRYQYSAERNTGGIAKTVIVPPAERMPWKDIPVEGKLDGMGSGPQSSFALPVVGLDEIPVKYAKYLDQVNDANQSCINDFKSEHCVNKECPIGEPTAALVIKNARYENVEIVSKRDDGLFQVRVTIPGSEFEKGIDCSNLGCMLSKPCYHNDKQKCAASKPYHSVNMFGDLQGNVRCPRYYEACRLVTQTVAAGSVKYQGRYCV